MTLALYIALGILLGGVGSMWHLLIVRYRARATARRALSEGRVRLSTSLWLMPLGIAGPVLAILAASQIDPIAAWVAIASFVVVRLVALPLLR